MKKIDNPFDWYPKEFWYWPEGDSKLVQVLDWVTDINHIMHFVDKVDLCIQAGGATGVWPVRFALNFRQVITFEPQPDNWECLKANIDGIANIRAINAPLSNDVEKLSIKNDIVERENWGAGYCVPDDNGLMAQRIDDLELSECDLIQLDIEGFELQALKGAAETIARFKPTIVLEEKPLNHVKTDPSLPRQWLEENFNYKKVSSIHKDVILKC